jgi:hypothetical protein
VRRDWEPEDLIACWTRVEADWELVGNKSGSTRLGFALPLKFFELEARFPRHGGEIPRPAVDYVAHQVGVDPAEFAGYDWSGRSIKYQARAGRLQPADRRGLSPLFWSNINPYGQIRQDMTRRLGLTATSLPALPGHAGG